MSEAPSQTTESKNEPWVEVTGSPHLSSWLASQRISLAFTTYQTGKLFLLGRQPDGKLAVFDARSTVRWACGQMARQSG